MKQRKSSGYHMLVSLLVAAFVMSYSQTSLSYNSPTTYVKKVSETTKAILLSGNSSEAMLEFVSQFDMPIFAKRCMVDHWKRLTTEQQDEFIRLFSKSLRRSLGNAFVKRVKGKKFSYSIGKPRVEEAKVTRVPVRLVVGDAALELNYFLTAESGSYRLVDYEVEGALLSRNYRGQFNYLMRKYGFEGMLERMRRKIAKNLFNDQVL